MDYIKKINKIIKILEDSNEMESANMIKMTLEESFTYTEILMKVTYNLKLILKKNITLKELIENDVDELIKYCKSIGLQISSSPKSKLK